MKPPVVFISYSHDSQERKDRILDLSDQLREDGVDCTIDQYVDSPPEGWPKWMDRQIEDSDFVLVVCTEIYYRRAMDEAEPSVGKGVKWESTLTYQEIYDSDARNTKFIPVLLDPDDAKYIPKPLKGATYYCIDTEEGYEKLYRRLTGQPEITKPELGKLQRLPARERKRGPVAVEVSLAKLPSTSPDLFGREKELKMLDEAWEDENTCVVSLVAFGGVGKTALVNVWLNEMQKDKYRGAERVYGWSFYSQGAREGAQASADEFIAAALGSFGDPDPTAGSPWDKGERLAGLVKRQRTLLILDGLEPLQYPPGELAGRLKDPGLQCLLRELARQNPGLCVITTRLGVDDLSEHVGTSVKRVDLEHLSAEAGMQLLRNLGAEGTDVELKQAVDEFDGHALALTLLSKYLAVVYGGDVRQRGKITKLAEEPRQGGHARRVMKSYEKWFEGQPELDILHIMGLFDRPAESGTIEAVRADPVIDGLTSELVKLSHADWQFALSNLREARLVAPEDTDRQDSLDCHPLIREHFGERLRDSNPDAWKEAHNRLYEYYNSQAREYPDTIEEMEKLYKALAHGCQAGRQREMFRQLYLPRILRGDQFFSTEVLGVIGDDLAALLSFFDSPWHEPVASLDKADKTFVLHQTGYRLFALGRLPEAIKPLQMGLSGHMELGNWKPAALAAGHLRAVYMNIGDLPHALKYARKSVELADRSGDAYEQMDRRLSLGYVLHQIGYLSDAEVAFREAEVIQKREKEIDHLPCFWYGDLLLDQGKYQEAQCRLGDALDILQYREHSPLLLSSTYYLLLGRCHLLEAQRKEICDFSQISILLSRALNGLRQSQRHDYLPCGLLALAALYRLMVDSEGERQYLYEAMTIATRGGMRLHEADCHLEYARLYLAMCDRDRMRESLDTAKKMIDEMGYHRRDPEVLLAAAHLHILEGKNDDARQTLAAARTLIDEMGCHRWDIEVKVLEEQLKV